MDASPWRTTRAAGWLLAGLLALGGCAPAIHQLLSGPPPPALPPDSRILVLPPSTYVPPGYDLLGSIFLGESGSTLNCGLSRMLTLARERARLVGANVVLVKRVIPPSIRSTCYQIEADLLRTTRTADASPNRGQDGYDSLRRPALLPGAAAYATLFAYRPPVAYDASQPLYLCLNDSVISRLAANGHYQRRLPASGRVRLALKDRPETELVIDLEAGREYFFRCDLEPTRLGSRARLVAESSVRGRLEYQQLTEK